MDAYPRDAASASVQASGIESGLTSSGARSYVGLALTPKVLLLDEPAAGVPRQSAENPLGRRRPSPCSLIERHARFQVHEAVLVDV